MFISRLKTKKLSPFVPEEAPSAGGKQNLQFALKRVEQNVIKFLNKVLNKDIQFKTLDVTL